MKFPVPLIEGRLVRRYKRFLSDVELVNAGDGSANGTVTAHCANPGSMLGLTTPGSEVWLSPATDPKRRLRYSWELIRVGDHLVGINTAHPNRLAAEAIVAGRIPELAGYETLRREVRYGRNSRIDILLEGGGRAPCYVEVKNVHLRRETAAEFPDSVTTRGAKHLDEMAEMVATAGARAVMLYIVQREDCDRFAIAGDIDPAYAAALDRARAAGVEVLCYSCTVRRNGIEVARPLPLAL